MRKILVIDDEYDIREMLTDFLGLKGYDVIVARNGQEGIEIFKKNKPDVHPPAHRGRFRRPDGG